MFHSYTVLYLSSFTLKSNSKTIYFKLQLRKRAARCTTQNTAINDIVSTDSTDQNKAGIVTIPPAKRCYRPLRRAVVLRLTEIVSVCIEDEARFQLHYQLIHTHVCFHFNTMTLYLHNCRPMLRVKTQAK